jgi:hypothetical protein
MSERVPFGVALRVILEMYLSGTSTPAPGKVVAITISQNGSAYAPPHIGAENATEIGSGTYFADLDPTDVGILGPLCVMGTAPGCDAAKARFRVVNPHTLGADALPNVVSGQPGSVARTADGLTIPEPLDVVNSNVVELNGTQLHGNGSTVPWGP